MFDLYLITDPDTPGGIEAAVAEALRDVPAGRLAVQLRAKTWSNAALLPVAHALRELTQRCGAALLVNGSPELASTVGADGVHVPEHDSGVAQARQLLGAHALVGASCHDAAGLRRAAAQGASFVTLSPVFAAPAKGAPLGVPRFAELTAGCALPVFALGGVEQAHAPALRAAGAHGIAVIRAVFAAKDRQHAVHALLRALDAAPCAAQLTARAGSPSLET